MNDFAFQASLPLLEAFLVHLVLYVGVGRAYAALKLAEVGEYYSAAGLLQLPALGEAYPLSLLLLVLIAQLHLKLAQLVVSKFKSSMTGQLPALRLPR